MQTLHTERLMLRPLVLADADDLFVIYSDERAMRFMPSAPHTLPQQTENMIQWDLARGGSHNWAICLRGSDRVIGKIDYLGQTRFPGMGYILHPEYWGQGIAPEACRAVLDYGFEHLGYDRVELWIDETNAPSTRVAQKLGFAPKGLLPLKYRHRDVYHFMVVWGMRQAEWQAESSATSAANPFYSVEPVLAVHDIIATTDYYCDQLGFHVDFLYGDPPTHAGVSRGEWSGQLVSLQLSQVPPERDIIPTGHLHIRVGMGLDAMHAEYVANGVEVVSPPEDKPWGFREFTIRDLNGHHLIFGRYL